MAKKKANSAKSQSKNFDSSIFQTIENCTKGEEENEEILDLEVSALEHFSGESVPGVNFSTDAHEEFCLIGALTDLLDEHPELVVNEMELFHDILLLITESNNKLDQLFKSMDIFKKLIPPEVRRKLLSHPFFLKKFGLNKKNIPRMPVPN